MLICLAFSQSLACCNCRTGTRLALFDARLTVFALLLYRMLIWCPKKFSDMLMNIYTVVHLFQGSITSQKDFISMSHTLMRSHSRGPCRKANGTQRDLPYFRPLPAPSRVFPHTSISRSLRPDLCILPVSLSEESANLVSKAPCIRRGT